VIGDAAPVYGRKLWDVAACVMYGVLIPHYFSSLSELICDAKQGVFFDSTKYFEK
jgi:hypothetical protein